MRACLALVVSVTSMASGCGCSSSLPKVLASAPVEQPSRLFFLSFDHTAKVRLGDDDSYGPGRRPAYGQERATVTLPDGGVVARDVVAVVDGDVVRLFDPDLTPRGVLTGLAQPSGVARDAHGGFVVADTGNDRLLRFDRDGSIDQRFGSAGEYRGSAQLPLRRPVSIGFDARQVLLEGGQLIRCGARSAFACEPGADFSTALSALGLGPLERFVVNARADEDTEQDLFLASGHLVERDVSLSGLDELRARVPVVDAVRSPDRVQSSYAWVDQQGRLVLRRWPWTEGPWAFPYRATAVATDRIGRLYVAGPGVVELRDFEPLK